MMRRSKVRTFALALVVFAGASLATVDRPDRSDSQQFAYTTSTPRLPKAPAAGTPRTIGQAATGTAAATLRAQAPLLEASTAIQDLATRKGFDGFAGAAIEGDTLALYWSGKIPSEVATAIAGYADRVRVDVRSAPYSAATLAAEAQRLSRLPGVSGAGALADFSGVWVGVPDADAMRRFSPPASTVKVVPRVKQRAVPLAWRWGDTEPFWGGAVVEHRSGFWPFYSYSYCTTGFAARRNSDSREAMTLSYHCGTSREWHTPEGGLTLGNTSAGVAGVDGAYITGRDYGASVYIGPNNGSGGVVINGYVIPARGTFVCYEGGFTGASCNSTVTEILAYEDGVGPGFWTEDASRQAPAGEGDSGGPVLAGSTGSGLNGIGVITLGDLSTQTTCQGLGDRICSWRVYNINLIAALVQQQLTLISVP